MELKSDLVVETYIASLPLPTANRMAGNYIFYFLQLTGQDNLAEEFGLIPFEIATQTIERLPYLSSEVEQYSHHLYDIFKILKSMTQDSSFPKLVQDIRCLRAHLLICPSVKQDIYINALLVAIVKIIFTEMTMK